LRRAPPLRRHGARASRHRFAGPAPDELRAAQQAPKSALGADAFPLRGLLGPFAGRTRSMKLIPLLFIFCGCATDNAGSPDGGRGGGLSTFSCLYADYFQGCKNCHTPSGPGRTSDTEQHLDFTSRSTAFSTITTMSAAGLTGNFAGCNGVPFVNASASKSL